MNGESGKTHENSKANDGTDKVSPIPSDTPPVTDVPARNAKNETTNQTYWQRRHYRVQLAIGIIGTIAVIIYGCQLSEMRKATRAAERAANLANKSIKQVEANERLDQRAWITVRVAMLDNELAVGQKPSVTLEIVNSGKTPGTMEVATAVSWGSETPHFDVPSSPRVSRMVVAPGVTVTTQCLPKAPMEKQDDIDLIHMSLSYVFVYGLLIYNDIFGQEHRTEFCFRITEDKLKKKPFLMTACETGNRAD